MQVETLGEQLSRPIPQIRHLIGSGLLVEDSKAVLYGVFKAGKSTLLQYIGLSCAAGLPLFSSKHLSTEKSRVLSLQIEMSHHAFLHRLKASSLSSLQDVRDNFYPWTEWWLKLDTSEGKNRLEEVIREVEPDVFILDPFYKTLTGSENSVQDLTRFFDNLDLLISQYHFSLLFSAQGRKTLLVPKMGKVDMGDEELRGSTAIGGWAETIMGIRRAGGNKRKLSFTVRHSTRARGNEFEETVEWNEQTGLYRLA